MNDWQGGSYERRAAEPPRREPTVWPGASPCTVLTPASASWPVYALAMMTSPLRDRFGVPLTDEPELLAGVTEARLVFGHTHLPVVYRRDPNGDLAGCPLTSRDSLRLSFAR